MALFIVPRGAYYVPCHDRSLGVIFRMSFRLTAAAGISGENGQFRAKCSPGLLPEVFALPAA
jgi:hypothetical protein